MFLILTFLIGLYACSTVTAVDSIDGALLAAELRKAKEGIGVNYLQDQFNNFPYETKSDTGNQLLQRSSLDVSLTQLNKVLTDVKDKIVNVNTDTDSSSLPRCCDIPDGQLTYIPKFQTKVDVSTACVTTSPIEMDNLKYPTDQISATMKNKYYLNKNVLWQHYSTTEGVSVIYPATNWENCRNFDPRYTSSYASAASPTDKDVVLVIDTSSSMKQPSGITAKTKMVIVKEAANNVIQTLKSNDRVKIVSFDEEAKTPSVPSTSHSCYGNELAFATIENADELKQHILTLNTGTTGDSNYEKALLAAFNYYHSSNDTLDKDNRECPGFVICSSIFQHKDIHKYTWTSPDGNIKNQIDHITIDKRFRRSMEDVRSYRGADVGSDHELLISRVKLKLCRQRVTQGQKKRYDPDKLKLHKSSDLS